ncbi:hypothetical protein [Paenibacillus sp. OV219]|uniref:hypothetical protein n=1 Tax=Paenibacillus sp. OV219 TaxID=1884377 RepID=UPI0008B740B2|nr:hypothetical protein [Paenibacillus sp. OV219]SEO63659.1 hypothetical protein SAMN05518847_10993 [Paenibacillus sp. OV219]
MIQNNEIRMEKLRIVIDGELSELDTQSVKVTMWTMERLLEKGTINYEQYEAEMHSYLRYLRFKYLIICERNDLQFNLAPKIVQRMQ